MNNGRVPPDETHRELKRASSEIAAKNLLLSSELVEILKGFHQRSISCISLRGITLGELLYGNITMRPTGDIDLLIRQEGLSEVRGLLCDLGFYEVEARPGFARDFYYTLTFFKERHMTVIVEPHWTIAYPPFLDRIKMEAVWDRSVVGEIASVETRLLGPEDLMIHLCLHILHHDDSAPFLWFYELDRLIRSEPFHPDWALFLSLVHEARLEPLIYVVLNRVRAVFKTPIPGMILEGLAGVPSTPFEARLFHLLTAAPNVKGREKIAMLLSLKGLRTRIRYAVSFLFPSSHFIRAQYGVSSRWQVGLTYFKRLCYLTWEGLKTVTRFLSSV